MNITNMMSLVVAVIAFTYFGGQNVPKILKDNKQMLLGVFVGLLMGQYFGVTIEGIKVLGDTPTAEEYQAERDKKKNRKRGVEIRMYHEPDIDKRCDEFPSSPTCAIADQYGGPSGCHWDSNRVRTCEKFDHCSDPPGMCVSSPTTPCAEPSDPSDPSDPSSVPGPGKCIAGTCRSSTGDYGDTKCDGYYADKDSCLTRSSLGDVRKDRNKKPCVFTSTNTAPK